MKFQDRNIYVLLLCLTCVLHSCNIEDSSSLLESKADSKAFRYVGRIDQQDTLAPILSGAASYVAFEFKGDSLVLKLEATHYSHGEHTFAALEIDGVYQKKFVVNDSAGIYEFKINSTKDAWHSARLHHASESLFGGLIFKGIAANSLRAEQQRPSATAVFFGDSMSSGAASDTTYSSCTNGHDNTNAYLAFPARLGRALEMDYVVHSVSGRGLYINWNGEDPPLPSLLPFLHLDTAIHTPYKMSSLDASLVVIALGTNDLNTAPTLRPPFDSILFERSYLDFIARVQDWYPNAAILLSSSAMYSNDKGKVLVRTLRRVARQARSTHPKLNIAVSELPDMILHGCPAGPHPSIEEHADIADHLLKDVKKLLRI